MDTVDFVSHLKSEIEKTEAVLTAQRTLLSYYDDKIVAPILKVETTAIRKKIAIPADADLNKQLLSMIKQHGVAERKPVFDKLFKDTTGVTVNIDHVFRALKAAKEVTTIKYNNALIKTYIGLNEWVDNGDFKAPHKNAKILPHELPKII